MRGSDLPRSDKGFDPKPLDPKPEKTGVHVCLGWKSKAAWGPREAEEGPVGPQRLEVQCSDLGLRAQDGGDTERSERSARDSSHCTLDILPVISTIPDSMLSRNCTRTCYNISESTIPFQNPPKSTKAQQRRNPQIKKRDLNNPAVSPSKTAKIQSPDENSPKS